MVKNWDILLDENAVIQIEGRVKLQPFFFEEYYHRPVQGTHGWGPVIRLTAKTIAVKGKRPSIPANGKGFDGFVVIDGARHDANISNMRRVRQNYGGVIIPKRKL